MTGQAILSVAIPLAFVVLFGALARADREPTVVAVIWIILVVDSALYASQNEVPAGIFHPELVGGSVRLVDIAVGAALAVAAVRWAAAPRLSATGIVWSATIVWVLVSGVVGLYNGNSGTLASFEAKVTLYLGAMFLTARIPFRRVLDGPWLLRLVRAAGLLSLVLVVTDETGLRIAADVPGLPLVDAGRLGSDAGTVFAAIGVLALGLGTLTERRAAWVVPAAPLLLAAFAADQRAALLALGVSLAVLFGVALAGARATGRRVHLTLAESFCAALAIAACFLVPVLVQLESPGRTAVAVPYVPQLTQTLYGRSKVLSAQERVNQLRAARDLIRQRPIFGWGLGKEFRYYRTGYKRFENIYLTHNILVDQWLRTGLVGLALLLAGFAMTAGVGLRHWRAPQDADVAALLLACLAVAAGLVAKGLVENLFEKYRMVLLLGLMLGSALAAVGPEPRRGPSRRDDEVVETVPGAAACLRPATPAMAAAG